MKTETDALKEAIEIAGGQSELARKISQASSSNVKQQQIWNWLNREQKTPSKHVLFVEKVTGVSRVRLRPDLYSN